MIKVNLFPFRAARIKENIRRQVTIYLLSVIFLILASSYFYLDLNNKVNALREERDVKQKELDSFKDTNRKIAALKKTIAKVEVKLKTIKRLEKGKTGPVKLLDDIAMSIPNSRCRSITLTKRVLKTPAAKTIKITISKNCVPAIFMEMKAANSGRVCRQVMTVIPLFT